MILNFIQSHGFEWRELTECSDDSGKMVALFFFHLNVRKTIDSLVRKLVSPKIDIFRVFKWRKNGADIFQESPLAPRTHSAALGKTACGHSTFSPVKIFVFEECCEYLHGIRH